MDGSSNWRTLRRTAILAAAGLVWAMLLAPGAQAEPIRILAFGDSLTAGQGLGRLESFPAKLQVALTERGHDVEVIDAGVSGDTTRGGAERLDWALQDKPDLVILELGANDALRGVSPFETKASLAAMLRKLKERGVAVLLAGMRAPPNLGPKFGEEFDRIYPDLAAEFGVDLYPFFLEGVAADPSLNLSDGMHPNAKGVDRIVEGIVGPVIEIIGRLRD